MILPACGSTYIPLVTHTNMYPLCAFFLRFYLFMNSCGIMDICIIIYSALSMQLFRCNLMSEMVMFTCSFIVVKSNIFF